MASRELFRTPAVEDYAKAIYTLESRTSEPVSTNALAERLGITAGSVSAMLKRLGEIALITHIPDRGVADRRRPPGGAQGAPATTAAESYLADVLGTPVGPRARRGRRAPSTRSEDLEALIAAKLGNPTVDPPTGDPIPSAGVSSGAPHAPAREPLQPGEQGVSLCALSEWGDCF